MPFDIIIPGHYFCDLIFTGLDHFPALGTEIFGQGVAVTTGGGALNTSIALRRLGVNVGWAGVLGNDFFSQYVHKALQKEGLSDTLLTRLDAPLSRVTVALSYPDDRAFVTYADTPPDLIDLAHKALEKTTPKHIHFAGLVISEDTVAFMDECKKRGVRVSMDCQHREETLDDSLVRETLSQLDLFMPNAIEAQRLTRSDNLATALQLLSDLVPTLVVKNGAEGAVVCCNGEQFQEPALSLTPLDTTGAGDCFNAGFLAAHLQGRDWSECLRWGNFCGGQSTLGVGGSKAPSLAELQRWLVQEQ
ncbi:MAG: carbohydrate kinase family protein [Chloroflexota bacterium]